MASTIVRTQASKGLAAEIVSAELQLISLLPQLLKLEEHVKEGLAIADLTH